MRQPVQYGKYLLLGRISVGGMAEVFKAKSFGVQGFEKIIAIKRILPSLGSDEEFITMFIDEAKTAGQLSHANIGQIHELGEAEGSHFIAMEFIWGRDLLQFQNRYKKLSKTISSSAAAYIMMNVCEGLDYAHRKRDVLGVPMNIVHRDCSPQNVVISFEGEVKLIDFGIAKAASRSSRTNAGVLKGKFGYMSPEQVRGLPLDQRSDIFALGAVLYGMLTGMRLFDGESDFATLEKVRNVEINRQGLHEAKVPEDLQAIVYKALARSVNDRYQWCSEMRDALRGYLRGVGEAYSGRLLSEEMREIFSEEFARETELMEMYGKIGPEGVPVEEETFEQLVTGNTPPAPVLSPHPAEGDDEEELELLDLEVEPEIEIDAEPEIEIDVPSKSRASDMPSPAPELSISTAEDVAPAEIFGEIDMGDASAENRIDPAVSTPTIDVADLFGDSEDHGISQPLIGASGTNKVMLADPQSRAPSASALVASLPTLGGPRRASAVTEQMSAVAGISGTHAALTMATERFPALTPVPLASAKSLSSSRGAKGGKPNKKILIGVGAILVAAAALFIARSAMSPSHAPAKAEDAQSSVSSTAPRPSAVSAGKGTEKKRAGVLVVALKDPQQSADVFLGDTKIGKVPSGGALTVSDLLEGKRELRIERDGEVGCESIVTLSASSRTSLVCDFGSKRFVDDARPKNLAGTTSHSGDRSTTSTSGSALRNGESTPRKSSNHHSSNRKSPVPAQAATGPGYFLPWTKPWARIHIDGKDTGKVSPVAPSKKISLSPGTHKVTFVVGDKDHTFSILIKSGQTTKLSKIFKP